MKLQLYFYSLVWLHWYNTLNQFSFQNFNKKVADILILYCTKTIVSNNTFMLTNFEIKIACWCVCGWDRLKLKYSGFCECELYMQKQNKNKCIHDLPVYVAFTCVYLWTQAAVDAGNIHTWQTYLSHSIYEKNPASPNLSPCQGKNGLVVGYPLLFFCG